MTQKTTQGAHEFGNFGIPDNFRCSYVLKDLGNFGDFAVFFIEFQNLLNCARVCLFFEVIVFYVRAFGHFSVLTFGWIFRCPDLWKSEMVATSMILCCLPCFFIDVHQLVGWKWAGVPKQGGQRIGCGAWTLETQEPTPLQRSNMSDRPR